MISVGVAKEVCLDHCTNANQKPNKNGNVRCCKLLVSGPDTANSSNCYYHAPALAMHAMLNDLCAHRIR